MGWEMFVQRYFASKHLVFGHEKTKFHVKSVYLLRKFRIKIKVSSFKSRYMEQDKKCRYRSLTTGEKSTLQVEFIDFFSDDGATHPLLKDEILIFGPEFSE